MSNFLRAGQLIPLLVIVILAVQIWRKFKSVPGEEAIGEERANYMITRLTWIGICSVLSAVLQIASIILRSTEAF